MGLTSQLWLEFIEDRFYTWALQKKKKKIDELCTTMISHSFSEAWLHCSFIW